MHPFTVRVASDCMPMQSNMETDRRRAENGVGPVVTVYSISPIMYPPVTMNYRMLYRPDPAFLCYSWSILPQAEQCHDRIGMTNEVQGLEI